jgi:hypothetical protein
MACSARLRSARQWICKPCVAASDRAFERLYPYAEPNQHQRNVSAFYGDLEARIAAIREQHALERAAA